MFKKSLVAAALLGMASMASAQHANYVLFGKGETDAAKQTAEQKFVHPVTTPYYHEDSFVTTDVRAWALYHDFSNDSIINGGSAKVYAAQIRVALTDQLQLVAYKDGYTAFDSGLVQDDGWNDVAAGLKWNFLQDWENQMHAAVGVGYEIPIGDPSVFQNTDELRIWGSFNKGFDKLHLGATVNAFFANGANNGLGSSDRFIWNLHADYYVCEWFSPVVEVNGFHAFDKGTEVVPFSALDVDNFGGGDDVVTLGIGGEVRPMENLGLRAAWETPLTDADNDLYGWRLTFSAVYSF